ncbi:DUF2721 domain-containing protein [Geobacter sp.]|uniref:DUF2721 domain-containing protein n=1 Tax=Geobacter sp. TaxID=46610 RepID=UPI001ACDC083|nr:DUF2721 domain-containing protein [Geobacter sp.]CAG0944866.1 hypothetical protein ANRL1_01992 [Anaerolineae bacterium]
MNELYDISNISNAIHLAVAPVFLLTGIGALLGVMTSRLGRVIDRARLLEGRLENAAPEDAASITAHLGILARRAKLINLAITCCTMTALLICSVIALLFSGSFVQFNIAIPVALLFILAMLLLVMGLLWFLREIFIATGSLRIGPR